MLKNRQVHFFNDTATTEIYTVLLSELLNTQSNIQLVELYD